MFASSMKYALPYPSTSYANTFPANGCSRTPKEQEISFRLPNACTAASISSASLRASAAVSYSYITKYTNGNMKNYFKNIRTSTKIHEKHHVSRNKIRKLRSIIRWAEGASNETCELGRPSLSIHKRFRRSVTVASEGVFVVCIGAVCDLVVPSSLNNQLDSTNPTIIERSSVFCRIPVLS